MKKFFNNLRRRFGLWLFDGNTGYCSGCGYESFLFGTMLPPCKVCGPDESLSKNIK